MSTELQKLIFSVSLLDQVTGPAGKLKKSLNGVANESKKAFSNIGVGAAGMAGAGYALRSMINPAIEMDRAIGEVRSLGVADDALKQLSNTALEFSIQYGKSATDFVRSSYDIQSAIAGLSGSELSAFTRSGGVLAAATKADVGTITDYMATLHGIFGDQANAMGNANWVEQITGQTATAVQMFKTDGAKMSAAFANLGASAASAGRDLSEQMAVLGSLQATMSGSESATKYKAFLAGVGKAQADLGLTFTDANGRMLGMVQILDAIKGKFGETLDVAEGDALKKAFGSTEAVQLIQLLIGNTDALGDSINNLGNIRGMDTAVAMAESMVDPWMRMGAGVNSLSIAIGQTLLPVLNPLITSLANGANELLIWTQKFPHLAKFIGTGALALIGLAAAFATLTLVVGLAKFAAIGFMLAMKPLIWIKTLIPAMATLRASILAVNIAMYANPVGLIVAGVVALGAAIGAVIYYWDDLKKAMMESSWMQWIIKQINQLITLLNYLPGVDIATMGTTGDNSALNAPKQLNTSPGGINKQISNSWSQESISRSVNIGQVVTSQPAATFEQEMLMAGS